MASVSVLSPMTIDDHSPAMMLITPKAAPTTTGPFASLDPKYDEYGVLDLDIDDSDAEEDSRASEKEAEGYTLAESRHNQGNAHNAREYGTVPTSGRRIAGSKRVASYRNTGGSLGGGTQIMQSITAMPSFADTSFEEIRTECYLQARVATGVRPRAVDPAKTPWAVIPPIFNAAQCSAELGGVDDDSDEAEMM